MCFISDNEIRSLFSENAQTIEQYDVSDCILYGRKFRRRLSGELAAAAEQLGCEPIVYQSIYWLCLVFIPIWPLAIYVVAPCRDPIEIGDSVKYRCLLTEWDSRQVATYYIVAVGAILTACFVVWSSI